jgi:hypothetical protein
MPLYRLTNTKLTPIPETGFAVEGLKERSDLQASIRDRIDIVAPDAMVLAEEYAQWDGSQRRIDLLALDKDANLIVIELKRTTDGGFMDLQAIRYASMVSSMTFEQAVQAHTAYLKSRGIDEDAGERILGFLGWEEADENEFAQQVQIVLASAEFSRELTTSVLWLRDHDLEIRCVRLQPYRVGDVLLINAEQVIPLPEADEYQVKVREKNRVEQVSRRSARDFTKHDVIIDGVVTERLNKRNSIFLVTKTLADRGVSVDQIDEVVSWRPNMWRQVEGEVDSETFCEIALKAAKADGPAFDSRRWFVADDQLIRQNGRTYALSNQWGGKTGEAMRRLIAAFPDKGVEVRVSGG